MNLRRFTCAFWLLVLVSGCSTEENPQNFCNAEIGAMIQIEGASIKIGDNPHYPEERGGQLETISGFYASQYEVTNGEFREFVDETGYITVAERQVDPSLYPNIPAEYLVPGSAVFDPPETLTNPHDITWWRFVPGANWKQPKGPGSTIEGKDYYPVVHVAMADAEAYARWKGHRLPTEEEHELLSTYAVKQSNNLYAPANANTWQGDFPLSDTGDDGYKGLAPVGCFDAGQNGLHDVVGNVWEWTKTPFYSKHNVSKSMRTEWPNGFDPNQPGVSVAVLKGGSYLCADNYCARFRPAAKQAQDTGLGASHIGFRTVKDQE